MYSWRSEVERQGESLLKRGMESGNQSQLGTGLQVTNNIFVQILGNLYQLLAY